MGEQLTVAPKKKVTVKVRVYVPDVNNNCPYAFENPSLAQLGIPKSLNRPVLHHVDIIGGEVYGKRTPGRRVHGSHEPHRQNQADRARP